MTQSLTELPSYTNSSFEDSSHTKTLLVQIRVIWETSNELEKKLTHVTKLQRGLVVFNTVSPMTNADKTVELRREAKLNLCVAK